MKMKNMITIEVYIKLLYVWIKFLMYFWIMSHKKSYLIDPEKKNDGCDCSCQSSVGTAVASC